MWIESLDVQAECENNDQGVVVGELDVSWLFCISTSQSSLKTPFNAAKTHKHHPSSLHPEPSIPIFTISSSPSLEKAIPFIQITCGIDIGNEAFVWTCKCSSTNQNTYRVPLEQGIQVLFYIGITEMEIMLGKRGKRREMCIMIWGFLVCWSPISIFENRGGRGDYL